MSNIDLNKNNNESITKKKKLLLKTTEPVIHNENITKKKKLLLKTTEPVIHSEKLNPPEEPHDEPVVEPIQEPTEVINQIITLVDLQTTEKEPENITEIIPYIKNIINKVRDKINNISLEIEKKSSVKNEKIQEIINKINVSETEYNEIKKRFYSNFKKKKVRYDLTYQEMILKHPEAKPYLVYLNECDKHIVIMENDLKNLIKQLKNKMSELNVLISNNTYIKTHYPINLKQVELENIENFTKMEIPKSPTKTTKNTNILKSRKTKKQKI